MDRNDLAGRTVALLIMEHDESGQEEWHRCLTFARWAGAELVLAIDVEPAWHPLLPVSDRVLGHVRATTPAIRAALGGAEFFVALPLDALPPEVDVAAYVASRLERA